MMKSGLTSCTNTMELLVEIKAAEPSPSFALVRHLEYTASVPSFETTHRVP